MHAVFRCRDFVIHPEMNRIERGGEVVRIEPRVMDLLSFLLRHGGEVLPKQRILAAVWPDRFVSEGVLARSVRQLRLALNDDVREPRFLETISKRGYRWIAPVVHDTADVAEMRADGPGCFLRVSDRAVLLQDGDNVVGRDAAADVQLMDTKVSRRHFCIRLERGRAVLEDLASKNGTWVRGVRVTSPVTLENGDRVLVGSIELVFVDPGAASTEPSS